jgi:hypothetical protein
MFMKDTKYNQEQKKTVRTVEKKKRKTEGKKPNRRIVYYVCSACNIAGSTHIEGKQ